MRLTVTRLNHRNSVANESSLFSQRNDEWTASNALLKTLETPPEQCVFVLLTQDKHKLLPTIISRCQHWQLSKVAKPVLLDWLGSQLSNEQMPDWFSLKMYAQSPLDALSFIKQDKQKEWEQLLDLLLAGVQKRSFSLFEVQNFFKNEPLEKVSWLLYLFNDLQKAHFGVTDAGRNLPDKEFRYLRTVIVTAAVYRGFDQELRPKTNPIN